MLASRNLTFVKCVSFPPASHFSLFPVSFAIPVSSYLSPYFLYPSYFPFILISPISRFPFLIVSLPAISYFSLSLLFSSFLFLLFSVSLFRFLFPVASYFLFFPLVFPIPPISCFSPISCFFPFLQFLPCPCFVRGSYRFGFIINFLFIRSLGGSLCIREHKEQLEENSIFSRIFNHS